MKNIILNTVLRIAINEIIFRIANSGSPVEIKGFGAFSIENTEGVKKILFTPSVELQKVVDQTPEWTPIL